MGIIEQMKKDGQDLSEPADLPRQRALLNRRTFTDPQMDRRYYRELVLTARYPPNKPKPQLHPRKNPAYYRNSGRETNGERTPRSYDDHEHSPRSSVDVY